MITESKNNSTQSPIFPGTKEWAANNFNIYHGCSNDCKYCYAKSMAVRFNRKSADNWFIEKLNEKNFNLRSKKHSGRIMFPTSHDITPNTYDAYSLVLGRLLEAGNEVLIVTKPNYMCINKLCDIFSDYRDKITFRFSIGSSDSDTLKFWEPNAPNFDERIRALEYAFKTGYATSVSIEPFLDNNVEKLVDTIRPFINDSIWIGKVNKMRMHLTNNGHTDTLTLEMATNLEGLYKSDYKFKLYNLYKDDPLIKWKDSLKKDFGIPLVTEIGADK